MLHLNSTFKETITIHLIRLSAVIATISLKGTSIYVFLHPCITYETFSKKRLRLYNPLRTSSVAIAYDNRMPIGLPNPSPDTTAI
jgi:hypothetical protein